MLSSRELVRKLKEVKDDDRLGGSAEDDEKEQSDKLQPGKKTLGWERQGPSMEEEKRRKTLNQARVAVRSSMAEGLLLEDGSVIVQRSRGRLLEGPLSWSCALQAVENHSLLLREEGGSGLSLQAAYARLAADEGRHEEKQRLRLFRARRSLSKAGYKVREFTAGQHDEPRSKAEAKEPSRSPERRATGHTDNVFAAPLFGIKIGRPPYADKFVEGIVRDVVSDLIGAVVQTVREEAGAVIGRKRSGDSERDESGPSKQLRVEEVDCQSSPPYKAENSEEEEEFEIVDIAEEEIEEVESDKDEVMEVDNEEDLGETGLLINPFHQSDNDEDEVEQVDEDEVEEVDEDEVEQIDEDEVEQVDEDEVEVTKEVAADPRAAIERRANKKLEAVKRLVDRDLANLANIERNSQPTIANKGVLGAFSCPDCKVPCSSKLTLEQHLIGKRHLRKVQRKAQAELQPVFKGLITAFTCRLCDVSAPSQEVLNVHLMGKRHLKSMARFRIATKLDRETILRSLPDTGSASPLRIMTHPINLPTSILPPNTMRHSGTAEVSCSDFSDHRIGNGRSPSPVSSDIIKIHQEQNIEEVMSTERLCRGFWPPYVANSRSGSILPNLCFAAPPFQRPSVQFPPSPPPLLLPPSSSPSQESRLPRRCPSPTLVLLSSSDDEAEEGENEGSEKPLMEEDRRSHPELPAELTEGSLASLWDSRSAVRPMVMPNMGKTVNEIYERLRLGPPELKGEWQKGGALIPDLDIYLADQPRHTPPSWRVLVQDASLPFPAPSDIAVGQVPLLVALEGGGDICYLEISPGPTAPP